MNEGLISAINKGGDGIEVECKFSGGVKRDFFYSVKQKLDNYYSWSMHETTTTDTIVTRKGKERRISHGIVETTMTKESLYWKIWHNIKMSVSRETRCSNIVDKNKWKLKITRQKQRFSYTHRTEKVPFRIDLTIVNNGQYEVELEIVPWLFSTDAETKKKWGNAWYKFICDLSHNGTISEKHFPNTYVKPIRYPGTVLERFMRCFTEQNTKFPGTMPVPFQRRHLKELNTCDFLLSEKTDGIRYFMLVIPPKVYFVSRNLNCFSSYPIQSQALHGVTLIDGELFTVPLTKYMDVRCPGSRSYNAFDIIYYNGADVSKKDLRSRLSILEKCTKAFYTYPFYIGIKTFYENSIKLKDKMQTYNGKHIYNRTTPTDGVMITHTGPYMRRTAHPLSYKWKFPELMSADFLLGVEGKHFTLKGWIKGKQHETLLRKTTLFHNNAAFIDAFELKYGTVNVMDFLKRNRAQVYVETTFDKNAGLWVFCKLRDKEHANHISVIFAVMEQTAEREITLDELMNKFLK